MWDRDLESKQALVRMMRAVALTLLLLVLLGTGACAHRNSVEGGASDGGAGAQIKLGLPF